MRNIKLGISPCPNDTFIFGPILLGYVPLPGMRVMPHIADVEELNGLAAACELDVVKISIHAYIDIWKHYVLLTSGGAIGQGCGPIIVAKRELSDDELRIANIAIPGRRTTAHLLLELFDLHKGKKTEMVFREIMPAVQRGDVDAGVVIHEGRWTYQYFGLVCTRDLAMLWEEATGLPLPLGGIAIRRELGRDVAECLNYCIQKSILYARDHVDEIMPFILDHAQEMDRDIVQKHIESFANEFSLEAGSEGKRAIVTIIEKACKKFGTGGDIKGAVPFFGDDM